MLLRRYHGTQVKKEEVKEVKKTKKASSKNKKAGE